MKRCAPTYRSVLLAACFLSALHSPTDANPLQTFTLKDHLQHAWSNELIHFSIAYPAEAAPESLMLTDVAGQPVPCQVTGLGRSGSTVTGTIWAVINLPPRGEAILQLRLGETISNAQQPNANAQGREPGTDSPLRHSAVGHSILDIQGKKVLVLAPPTSLRLLPQGPEYVLRNEFMAIRLPKLPGALPQPVELATLPPPLLALAGPDSTNWLGQGAWANTGAPLLVKDASTTVIEEGPVRVTVRYRLTFVDGRFYQADISLGDRQECARFTDDTDIYSPTAAFRFSFLPGLGADRVFWANNFYAETTKGFSPEPVVFKPERMLFRMRPWSFWWEKDLATWAGFYRAGNDAFVGVLAIRPSQWTPIGWDGFAHTEAPITARAQGELDLSLALLAFKPREQVKQSFGYGKDADDVFVQYSYIARSGAENLPGGIPDVVPLHREWAFTVGSVSTHVTNDIAKTALRRQLVKYGEFPLDDVKDFGFADKDTKHARKHPYLLFTEADVERARRQAKTVPAVKEALAKATNVIARLNMDALLAKIGKGPDGWKAFYRENYLGNGMGGNVQPAYICSDDAKYGTLMAASVKGMTRALIDQYLEAPGRATMAGNGHFGGSPMLNLMLAFDAVADAGYLTAEDKQDAEAALVFGAHVLDHADYWNTDAALCSANPNMTSMLRLPLGMLALYLDGHAKAASWLESAETELQHELKEWIAPGGAWLECPFYQVASLDGMFLLAQALKNVKGRDYFADPQFKATMDYYGFILTPPDARFPPGQPVTNLTWMTIPGMGDGFPGFQHPFNGWMAKATAQSDPAYSARQQAYWRGQTFTHLNGGRATDYLTTVCDPDLPAAPPAELARAFPGFGNILRSSWTDPKASYLAHRCGYFFHHYHADYNEIVYYAKGAPLCMDFAPRGGTGENWQTLRRADYHNTVSLARPGTTNQWLLSGGDPQTNRLAQEVRTLSRTLDYSAGSSYGDGGQVVNRHVALVKSDDPLGATYVVMRDLTLDGAHSATGGQPGQEFACNLWCMSTGVVAEGNVAHFPGPFGVDLDAHVLSPASPRFVTNHWKYSQWVHPWGTFVEEQYGVHVGKSGSTDDFFSVLYPRATGQGPAQLTLLDKGRAVEVKHMEGADVVLFTPGLPAAVASGDARLDGEVAFARRYNDGTLRLAVVKGTNALASLGPWALRSSQPTSIEISPAGVAGESSGGAHEAHLELPPDYGTATVTLDGRPAQGRRDGNRLTLALPGGAHVFAIRNR